MSVAEIIALYGQEGFRRMEQAALNQLLSRKELMVLATGGGIVSEPLTFELILSSFYTIWIKADPEEHMGRVRKQGDLRPMADDRSAMAELRNILVSREPLYARASAVVDTAGLSVDAAAARLLDTVRPVLQNEARAFGLRSVGGLAAEGLPWTSARRRKRISRPSWRWSGSTAMSRWSAGGKRISTPPRSKILRTNISSRARPPKNSSPLPFCRV